MVYHPKPPPPEMVCPTELVPKIDQLYKMGYTAKALADAFQWHPQTVRGILKRKGAYAGIPKT